MRTGATTYRAFVTTVSALLILSLTACGGFWQWSDGLPARSQVELTLKGGAHDALVGDTSEYAGFYQITRGVTVGVNLMVVGLLALTRGIVQAQPSERPDQDHATWGPSEPKGLERLQYKAEAERVAENEFKFWLKARPKGSESEDDYGTIYEVHYFRSGIDQGHGEIKIDRDEHAAIDPNDATICETGHALISFSNDGEDGMKIVDIDFTNLDRSACEDDGQLGVYHYAEAMDGSGDFSFYAMANIHAPHEVNKTALEMLTIRSRWTAEGAGRSDVILSGDDIADDLATCGTPCDGASEVVVSQCWDSGFVSRYENTDPEVLQPILLPGTDAQGNANPVGEATDCAFEYAEPDENLS